MDVILARLQFYFTIGFHYLWPPVSIGMAWIIFFIMTKYKNTGEKVYRVLAKFWLNIFALVFAVGVATGITMEFQFGTNWSEYSRFVGNIFGAPLAIEGVFAFFLESSFLGLLLFGWKRLSVKVHWFSSLMVAIGSTLSAFWIIVANSWQQTPAGHKIVNGQAILVNFWESVFNHSTIERFSHVIVSAIATGAFVMLSISAYYLIKKKHQDFARKSFIIALVFALLGSYGQLVTGHASAIYVWKYQPLKLAAFEGQWETETNVGLSLFGLPIESAEKTYMDIRLPGMLSLMLGHSTDTEVKGIKEWPKEEWPPLFLTSVSYHGMVGLGVLMIIITTLAIFLYRKGTLFENKLILYLFLPGFLYPTLANQLGWIAAEVGRQPWIVYGLLKTSEGVSITVPWYQIVISMMLFLAMYTLLAYAFYFVLKRKLETGPEPVFETAKEEEVKS